MLPILPPILKPIAKPLPLPVLAKPVARGRIDGDASQGYAQVLLPAPDDAAARVMFVSAGVEFVAHGSLQPVHGVLTMHSPPSKGGMYAYRWRN